MYLRSIHAVRKDDFGYTSKFDHTKPLIMTVTVGDGKSETKLELDETATQRVLEVLAEELAFQAKRVAETMTANIFDASTPALPAPPERSMSEPNDVHTNLNDEIPF